MSRCVVVCCGMNSCGVVCRVVRVCRGVPWWVLVWCAKVCVCVCMRVCSGCESVFRVLACRAVL